VGEKFSKTNSTTSIGEVHLIELSVDLADGQLGLT
jgi:hypothetical protein